MTWKYLIEGPWLVFVAYWIIGALKTRRTARKEPFAWRYGITFFEILGFVLMFNDDAGIGALGNRVFRSPLRSSGRRHRPDLGRHRAGIGEGIQSFLAQVSQADEAVLPSPP